MRRLRISVLVASFVGVAIVAAWLAAPTPQDGLPLAPDSAAEDGTMALVETLEALGADVVVEPTPPDDADTALLLVDNIDEDTRAAWREVATRGGTLVVADPSSELAPDQVGDSAFGLIDPPMRAQCDLPALEEVAEVQTAGGATLDVPPGAVGCFPRGGGHWLVAMPQGSGVVVATGGASFVTNDALADTDNAMLAAALLAPRPGDVVAIAPPDFAAAGEGQGLAELIPDGAWLLAIQLTIAFVVLILWRVRRLGPPVVEEGEVALPGSELVIGLGNLYHQTGSAHYAARMLREDLRSSAAARLGLEPQSGIAEVAEAAVGVGLDPDLVHNALTGPVPRSDAGLVDLAGDIEKARMGLSRTDLGSREGAARV